MNQHISCALTLAISTALAGCDIAPAQPTPAMEAPMHADSFASNPFAAPSLLPMHYPPFDNIKNTDCIPAFDKSMAEQLHDMDMIANNQEAATFANTSVAMEKSCQFLDRASNVFFNLQGTYMNNVRDVIELEYSPKPSVHRDAIFLNPVLFARIKTLYDASTTLGLDPIDQRLLEKRYKDFVRAGAALNDAQKARIRTINSQLSTLGTQFDQNVLAEVNDSTVVVDRALSR